MKVSLESQLTLNPLSIQKDKKNYIVEEPISGDFFEMPKICIDAIERLAEGQTVGAVEKDIKNYYPDEKVDVIEFAEQLIDLGLVQDVDGVQVKSSKAKIAPSGSRSNGFLWISARFARLFFNQTMNKLYLFLFLLNGCLLILNPGFFPHYQDIFLFESMMLNMITYMAISFVLILIHEFGHILAIRAHELPANLSIGNRLIFIVFETDLTPAWKLAPRERNVLYLAGMAFEQVIIFLAFGLMLLFPDANLVRVLGIVVFDIFIKTIYQCCFYMKTDVYYVVETITGCYNLMESGKSYLRTLFWKHQKTTKVNYQIFEDEGNVIRVYSLFYIIGILTTLLLFFGYFLPQLYYVYATIFSRIVELDDAVAYWDDLAFSGQIVIMVGLLIYLMIKRKQEGIEK